jgi:hypothetical protein
MKLVVQNEEVLTRKDLELFLERLPFAWKAGIDKIVVFESTGAQVLCSFHKKDCALGIHIPTEYSGSTSEVLREVAVTIQAIQNYGHIPEKLPVSQIREYRSRWQYL